MLKFVRNTWKYWSYETDDEILILLVLVQCLWTLKVVFWAEFLWEIGFGFISGNYLYLSVLRKSKKKPEKYLKLSWYKIFSKKPELARISIGFCLTAPFNNMWTLKFKARPTYACFATVNQTVFGGSSQLPTTRERAVIKSLCTVQTKKQCSAVALSWEEPPNIWLTAAKTHLSVDLWILEYAWYWKAQ